MGEQITQNPMNILLELPGNSLSYVIKALVDTILRNSANNSILPTPDEVYAALSKELSYITPLENQLIMNISVIQPFKVFRGLTLVGIDSSSFVFRGHPLRLIIARSGVFVYSQRTMKILRVFNPFKYVLGIVHSLDDELDEEISRFESRCMSYVEIKTAETIAKTVPDLVDIIFFDGPIFTKHNYDLMLDLLKLLKEKNIISFHVVKNCTSSKIMSASGYFGLLDSDFFSYYLKPGQRSCFMIWKKVIIGNKEINVPEEFLPVFAYFMTWKKQLLRVEVPKWIYDKYGLELIERIIVSDIILGNKETSYMISRADRLAKFSERERRMLEFNLRVLAQRLGFSSPEFYNQKRWWIREM